MEEYIIGLINKCIQPIIEKLDNTQQPTHKKPLMNVSALSEYLDISESWIRQNIRDLPVVYIGSSPRFNIEDIDNWRLKRSVVASEQKQKVKIRIAK